MKKTKMIYRLKVTVMNARTGQKMTREVSINGHGRPSVNGLETLLVIGADLYSSGWDKSELAVEHVEVVAREELTYVVRN